MPADRKRHRVAVVVFAEAEGHDAVDAGDALALIVRKALTNEGCTLGHFADRTVTFTPSNGQPEWSVTARPIKVMDVGDALGNGYLWANITPKAFKEAPCD